MGCGDPGIYFRQCRRFVYLYGDHGGADEGVFGEMTAPNKQFDPFAQEVQPVGCVLPNTLVHGDCLEVMKYIPDGSIDLVLADPPYG